MARPPLPLQPNRPLPPLPPNSHPHAIPPNQNQNGASGSSKTLKSHIVHSQEIYRRDLRALFGHAKDRFGDVKWGTGAGFLRDGGASGHGADRSGGHAREEDEQEGRGFEVVDFALAGLDQTLNPGAGGMQEKVDEEEEMVWAHKAIIYSRASKSFKSRFFPSTTNSSPTTGHAQSPSSRAPSTTPSSSGQGQYLHPNSHSHSASTSSNPQNTPNPNTRPRYTRSASVLSNRPRDTHGVTVLDDLGMKEMLSLGLEGMYDPDVVVARTGLREANGGEQGEEEEMEWLSIQGGEPGREEEQGFGLGLGVGLGLGALGKGKGREVDVDRTEEIRSLVREKQSQDLTYMWRSKLYADVLIQIPNPASSSSRNPNQKGVKPPPSSFRQTPVIRRATSFSSVKQPTEGGARPGSSLSFNLDLDKDLGFEVDEETGGMTFSAHRFMLCSRSPYFAQVLLNAGEFQPHLASAAFNSKAGAGSAGQGRQAGMPVIALSSPPFTPQAMHFIMGYIYSGSLGKFSNKQLDMATALLVRKGAAYLEMEALEKEVEGRLIWEFAHGVAWDDRVEGSGATIRKCRCRKCVKRIPRLLRFATSPDVGSKELEAITKEYVVSGWSECLGKDVALLDERVRDGVIDDIVARIHFGSVVTGVRGLLTARRRLEQEGKPGDEWYDDIEDVLDIIAERIVEVMTGDLGKVLRSTEMMDLVQKPIVDFEVLEALLNLLVQGIGRVEYCRRAPLVHQHLMLGLLDKRDEQTEQLMLSDGSRVHEIVNDARSGILSVLRKRWMQIRQEGGFADLDPAALEGLAKSMGVSPDDLVQQVPKRKPAVSLNSSTASRTSQGEKREPPQPRPRMPSLDSRTSVRIPPTLGPPVVVTGSDTSTSLPRSTSRNVSTSVVATPGSIRPVGSTSQRVGVPASASISTIGGRSTPTSAKRLLPGAPSPAKGSASRLARVAGGTNAQAGPSEPKRASATPTTTPPRPRALSTPGSQRRKAIDVELAPPLPVTGQTPSAKPVVTPPGSSLRTGVKTPEPRHASIKPRLSDARHAVSRQTSVTSLSDVRDRTVSTPGQKPAVGRTPAATPTSSPGRRTPTANQQRNMSTSPTTMTRSPLTPRERVPTVPSAKQTASTLAKKVSVPAMNAKRTEELKKVPTKSASSSSIRTLRTSPAPSKTATSTLAAPTKSTLSNIRPRVSSSSTIRSRIDSNASLAEKPPVTGVRSASGTAIPPPRPGSKIKDVATKKKELSETTDETRSDIITPTLEHGDTLNIPIIRGPDSNDSDELGAPEGLPKIVEPTSTSLSTTANEDPATEADPNSTLPRSFGSQLDTHKKIVLGLPVPTESRRPSMQILRTASASAAPAYSENNGRYHPATAFDPPPRPPAASTPAHTLAPPDDGIPIIEARYGSSLSVGIPCIVALSQGRVHKFKAMARYIGRLNSGKLAGEWVGVEVEERFLEKTGLQNMPDRFTSDGTFDGRRYFKLEQQGSSLRRASHANFGQAASLSGRLRGASTAPQDIYGRRGMRSASASPVPWQRVDDDPGSSGKTVALFVRPNEIVFVLEAGE